jgi:hypothetical protein
VNRLPHKYLICPVLPIADAGKNGTSKMTKIPIMLASVTGESRQSITVVIDDQMTLGGFFQHDLTLEKFL